MVSQMHIVCGIALTAQPEDAVTQEWLDPLHDRI